MHITGCLSECSWSELLTWVERLQLTGCLKIHPLLLGDRMVKTHQVWFAQGALVGATRVSRRNHLFWLMQHQGWLNYATAQQIAKCCPPGLPVGTYFRQQGVLTTQQLQHLFQVQMMTALAGLSDLEAGQFELDTAGVLPCDRLTGLQLSVYDAIHLCRQRRSSLVAAATLA